MDAIKLRAQRDPQFPVQTTSINLACRIPFPNGDTVRVIVPDLKFGSMPIAIAGRDAYVSTTFTFQASDYRFLT
jgi:hypothetical protein